MPELYNSTAVRTLLLAEYRWQDLPLDMFVFDFFWHCVFNRDTADAYAGIFNAVMSGERAVVEARFHQIQDMGPEIESFKQQQPQQWTMEASPATKGSEEAKAQLAIIKLHAPAFCTRLQHQMTLFEAGQLNDIRIFGGDRHTGVLMFGDYPPEILNIIRRVHMPASLSMESLSQELSDTYLQWYTQGRYYITGPIQSILQGLSDEAIYASKQYEHSVTNEGHIDAGHTEFEMLRLLWDACHATMSPCDFEHGIQPQISSACFMLHLAAKTSSTSPSSDMYGERPVPVGRSFLSVMQMYRTLFIAAKRTAK
eukprot:SAG25_NODE_1275_length_3423_cov_1.488869_1_plen_310_part_10